MKLYPKGVWQQSLEAPRHRRQDKLCRRARIRTLVQEIAAAKHRRVVEQKTAQRTQPSKLESEVASHNVLMLKVAVGWPKSATSVKQSSRRPVVLGRFEDDGRFRCRVQQYDTNGNSLSDEHKHRGSLDVLPGDIELIHSFSKHYHNLPEAVSNMLLRQERRFYHLFYSYWGIRNTWQ
ncbi:hypothetical protein CABS01_16723 [Colletotrichum abscissum]|uniref:uncharacterized protein n=1 Tax=Colletotrichum abscissum TaxID=1671311 RepID=UPI0027D67D1F|nr:uncharacterized protein CABS01_16723 [Colletotrichum abscissum]KAK1515368.1 hypothetical protein CABS01_16723 [Colletotrichum abscissum]